MCLSQVMRTGMEIILYYMHHDMPQRSLSTLWPKEASLTLPDENVPVFHILLDAASKAQIYGRAVVSRCMQTVWLTSYRCADQGVERHRTDSTYKHLQANVRMFIGMLYTAKLSTCFDCGSWSNHMLPCGLLHHIRLNMMERY